MVTPYFINKRKLENEIISKAVFQNIFIVIIMGSFLVKYMSIKYEIKT